MLGFVVSQTTVLLSHALQFAILLATFTNLTQHTFYICWNRRRHLQEPQRFGPAYLVAASTIFIMVHPTYLVLKVARKAYSLSGWQLHSMQCCTIVGYVLLSIGITWATSLFSRLQVWWQDNPKEL
mmetsp:Transcript_92731/g.146608  ORF Transcript_92731/g.146608 Transcript_92731/m.146608 type:complete len:126 (+) Transcript_92731:274-651(+)